MYIYIYINSGYIILGVIKVIYTTHLEPTRFTLSTSQRIFSAACGLKMAWLGARSRFEHFAHALPSTKPGTGGPGTTVNNCPNYRTVFFSRIFGRRSKKTRPHSGPKE